MTKLNQEQGKQLAKAIWVAYAQASEEFRKNSAQSSKR